MQTSWSKRKAFYNNTERHTVSYSRLLQNTQHGSHRLTGGGHVMEALNMILLTDFAGTGPTFTTGPIGTDSRDRSYMITGLGRTSGRWKQGSFCAYVVIPRNGLLPLGHRSTTNVWTVPGPQGNGWTEIWCWVNVNYTTTPSSIE